jgi:uncharacterized membrane protein
MRKSEIIILLIALASFGVGLYFYGQMPEVVASHWNDRGEVNGYMSRFWGIFLMPIISLGMLLLFILIPRLDPLKANIEKFRKYFDVFIVLISLFFLYVYLLTIFWNLGSKFNLVQFMAPAFGVLFYAAGVLIKNSKRNYFIGIRTPWTLQSDEVWDRTHRRGGLLFRVAGVIAAFGVIFPKQAIWLLLAPVGAFTIYIVIYSYLEYKKVGSMNN